MTTPLVFKAFNLIEKLNSYSYPYMIRWDPKKRKLSSVNNSRALIPWHLANIGVVFLIHFCLPISLLSFRKTIWGTTLSDKDLLQLGSMGMMSCHSTASYGINILIWIYGRDFVPLFNALLALEAQLRGHYITMKDVKVASMVKELNPKKLANQESDMLGLCIFTIIHILTVVPAITPLSLVLEDVDPVGVFIKKFILQDFVSVNLEAKIAINAFRVLILTVAMLEISQTFRTVFNFGLSVFHIYRKCMEVPVLSTWKGEKTITIYNQLQTLHAGMTGFFTPLAALFLGLNFIILTVSTVLCLVSYRILPIHIYAGIPAATLMAYFLLFASLPCAIHCHEETQRLILVWHRQVATNNAATLRFWKRALRKLRPISFYCGGTGLLTKQSKRIYMASIIDATVNVLILWRGMA